MNKIIFLAILIVLIITLLTLSSCNNFQSRNKILPTPTITPLNDLSNTHANYQFTNQREDEKTIKLLESIAPSKEETERGKSILRQKIYVKAKFLTQKSQLVDLEQVKLKEGDKEIRIWIVEPNVERKVFVSTYKEERWETLDFIQKDFKGDLKKRKLEEPVSGWNSWKNFIENNITPVKIKNSDSQASGTDGTVFVIEVKFGQDYAKNIFFNPDLNQKDLNLLDVINKEFPEFK